MAHNVYRYRSLLKSPNGLLNLLAQIPFMNGGLFECLDKTLGTKENPQYIRIDGFSDRDDNALNVPNSLFWGAGRVVDLSESYGENKYSSSRVSGLVRIFDHYKFTVAENTPLDEEIALDPELLGKVFENLLAAYNPETGATARKQTGSFYTPREIVNYMVDESLISSLSTNLKDALPKAGQVEERIRQLVAYSHQSHQFTGHEVNALIYAIDHLKILDPACGSGAFPMGILHKLVFVLAKLDPGNQRWKARQMAKANEIPDFTVREQVLADIERDFNANELDYGRKLYLIENCIYGVDIQPIAVQISKLRFFISLIVDQKVNPTQDNLGIRPLPNLETRFVAANSLMGLQRPAQQMLRGPEIDAKETELRGIRERHFLARTPATKARCREQDAALRTAIAELLRRDGWSPATARTLATWDPYDQNAFAEFFDPEWMFGLTRGFDIIIANPPYIGESGHKELFRNTKEGTLGTFYLGKMDYFYFFFHLALNVANPAGEIAFISTNYYLTATGARKLRADFKQRAVVRGLINFNELHIFESALGQHNIVTLLRKDSRDDMVRTCITNRTGQASQDVLSRILAWNDKQSRYYEVTQVDLYDGVENYIRLNRESVCVGGSTPMINGVLDKVAAQGVILDKLANINQGVVSGCDYVSKRNADSLPSNGDWELGDAIFVFDLDNPRDNRVVRGFSVGEKRLLRPFYKNSEIRRFSCSSSTTKRLLYIGRDINDLGKYPRVLEHLKKYRSI